MPQVAERCRSLSFSRASLVHSFATSPVVGCVSFEQGPHVGRRTFRSVPTSRGRISLSVQYLRDLSGLRVDAPHSIEVYENYVSGVDTAHASELQRAVTADARAGLHAVSEAATEESPPATQGSRTPQARNTPNRPGQGGFHGGHDHGAAASDAGLPIPVAHRTTGHRRHGSDGAPADAVLARLHGDAPSGEGRGERSRGATSLPEGEGMWRRDVQHPPVAALSGAKPGQGGASTSPHAAHSPCAGAGTRGRVGGHRPSLSDSSEDTNPGGTPPLHGRSGRGGGMRRAGSGAQLAALSRLQFASASGAEAGGAGTPSGTPPFAMGTPSVRSGIASPAASLQAGGHGVLADASPPYAVTHASPENAGPDGAGPGPRISHEPVPARSGTKKSSSALTALMRAGGGGGTAAGRAILPSPSDAPLREAAGVALPSARQTMQQLQQSPAMGMHAMETGPGAGQMVPYTSGMGAAVGAATPLSPGDPAASGTPQSLEPRGLPQSLTPSQAASLPSSAPYYAVPPASAAGPSAVAVQGGGAAQSWAWGAATPGHSPSGLNSGPGAGGEASTVPHGIGTPPLHQGHRLMGRARHVVPDAPTGPGQRQRAVSIGGDGAPPGTDGGGRPGPPSAKAWDLREGYAPGHGPMAPGKGTAVTGTDAPANGTRRQGRDATRRRSLPAAGAGPETPEGDACPAAAADRRPAEGGLNQAGPDIGRILAGGLTRSPGGGAASDARDERAACDDGSGGLETIRGTDECEEGPSDSDEVRAATSHPPPSPFVHTRMPPSPLARAGRAVCGGGHADADATR